MSSVAICQSIIHLGGRLRVILAITEVLNDLGIVPSLITGKLIVDPERFSDYYGRQVRLSTKTVSIPWFSILPGELSIAIFNAMLRFYVSRFSLLINSSNSLIFLPPEKPVVSYIHFPREKRIQAANHHRNRRIYSERKRLARRYLNIGMQILYKLSNPYEQHQIICNSLFTKDALMSVYNLSNEPTVIYPPVDLEEYSGITNQRDLAVVSIGRFEQKKGQLEQIEVAKELPNIMFHIIGFVNDQDYYIQCREYALKNDLVNVKLHPNATKQEIVDLLRRSKYFLHSLIDEPFGLTTVEAIAAGCLPMVHDSGGQVETVPIKLLRYRRLSEIPEMIRSLEELDKMEVEKLVSTLRRQASDLFDARHFHRKMTGILRPYLDEIPK